MLGRQRCTNLGMNWFALIALLSTSLLSGCVFRELNEQHEERLRSDDAQITARFAAVTAAGEVTTLSDPRFRAENVRAGMRAPYDFILNVGPGVYFLEKYDPSRIPVLFVHGMDGSPDNFRYLIERLDRRRFQAWVYYYPSGARLGLIADHMTQTVLQVERHYGVTTLVVVAHSMGGLVARGFLLRHKPDRLHIPLFISLSTPWSGHSAAQMGSSFRLRPCGPGMTWRRQATICSHSSTRKPLRADRCRNERSISCCSRSRKATARSANPAIRSLPWPASCAPKRRTRQQASTGSTPRTWGYSKIRRYPCV